MSQIPEYSIISYIIASMLRTATPIIFAALGESCVQSAGIINIGIEGVMLAGAYTGFIAAVAAGSAQVGVLIGAVTGILVALLVAFLTVTIGADQVVTGIALYFAAIGFTSLSFRLTYKIGELPQLSPPGDIIYIPGISSIPVIGEALFNHSILVYIAILLAPIFYYVLYRTTFGLKLRALGENPMAADTAGVNVFFLRYVVLIVGGALAGIGGAYLSLYQISVFQDQMVAGRGWVAIALVLFARWDPLKVLLGSLLYGVAESSIGAAQALGFLRTLPVEVVLMIPYIVTIIALVILARRARLPPALGKPYRREA